MKKFTLAVLTVILFLTFSIINSYSQWQPDVRLTNDPAASVIAGNNNWCVAADNNFVHMVWFDLRNNNNTGKWEIYYKRSTDSGITWGTDTRLTNDTNSWSPAIAVSGLSVHIVWWKMDYPGVYYKRSTDGGATWGPENRLITYSAMSPSIAVSGSNVYVVYEGLNFAEGTEIMYKRSTDGGVNWGADTRLTYDTVNSRYPSIAVSGNNLHVVWDTRDSQNEIYYKRSTDGGVNWGADTRLTNNTGFSYVPSIAVSGNKVHVVWQDDYEIYYKRSTDGGATWGGDMNLTNNISVSQQPCIVVSGNTVHITWYDDRDGNSEIYYKRSTDEGNTWETDTRLTNDFDISLYPSIAVSGSILNVVWEENRDGNREIYYKRNPTGNPIGIIQIGSEVPDNFSLSQNFPNPFNPTTNFEFRIAEFGFVSLIIYDVMGREVTTLVNEGLKPGIYEVDWNASNFSSGVYFYKITSGDFTDTKRMILLK